MTDSIAATSGSFPATLQTTRGPLVLDLNDAQAITRSLRNFLDTNPSVKSIPMLDSTSYAWLRGGDAPFVDSDGWVRIGLWLLQARGDAVVLIYRAPGATTGQVSYQYVASVSFDARRQWQVTAINWEKLLAR